jgi:hypothetical protein
MFALAEQRDEVASPHGRPSSGLAAARYHTVAPERRCALQQKLRTDVADGSMLLKKSSWILANHDSVV